MTRRTKGDLRVVALALVESALPMILLAATLVLALQAPSPTLKFVRLVGPAKTVAKWDAATQAFFKSLRVE